MIQIRKIALMGAALAALDRTPASPPAPARKEVKITLQATEGGPRIDKTMPHQGSREMARRAKRMKESGE
jgi:hypothetical protein